MIGLWCVQTVHQVPAGIQAHVVPMYDLREHDLHGQCWCRPSQDEEDPAVWVHNALDRREDYESGQKELQ